MNILELSDVRVAYGDRVVLDLHSLAIRAGQAYSLQGPNGAGKSTLLGILSFLNPPHSGEVLFNGARVCWKEASLRPLRQEVGLVEQHPVMFSCSVRANVGYGLAIRGLDKSRRRPMVDAALELVGLSHLADAYAPCLSGGETQRIAIARALACRPRVLLLDEPTASVDTQNRVIIEQVVADLRDQGETTIVLCTHNRSQAWALCPNVIYLEDGRLVSQASANAYAGQLIRENGRSWCRITDGFLVPAAGGGEGRVRVSIDSEAVVLRPASGAGPNRGLLTRLRLEGDAVELHVDLGRLLRVQMPLADFRAAGFSVGEMVEAEIPASAVAVFPGA